MKLGLCRVPSCTDVSETVAVALPCQSSADVSMTVAVSEMVAVTFPFHSCADISMTVAMALPRQSCANVSGR